MGLDVPLGVVHELLQKEQGGGCLLSSRVGGAQAADAVDTKAGDAGDCASEDRALGPDILGGNWFHFHDQLLTLIHFNVGVDV